MLTVDRYGRSEGVYTGYALTSVNGQVQSGLRSWSNRVCLRSTKDVGFGVGSCY